MSWDSREVFDQKAFIEKESKETDFFQDFFITRSWMLFLEGKIAPETVSQVQLHKQFDQCIEKLDNKAYFDISNDFFGDSIPEAKEEFEFLFNPDRFMNLSHSLKYSYINTLDFNGICIDQCVKTMEIQE